MKNFVQEGELITIVATAPVTSGAFVVVGALSGVASATAAIGEPFNIKRKGVFNSQPKATGTAWAVGDKLYWNANDSKFTKSASGNTLAGCAAVAADTGDTLGTVLLTGQVA